MMLILCSILDKICIARLLSVVFAAGECSSLKPIDHRFAVKNNNTAYRRRWRLENGSFHLKRKLLPIRHHHHHCVYMYIHIYIGRAHEDRSAVIMNRSLIRVSCARARGVYNYYMSRRGRERVDGFASPYCQGKHTISRAYPVYASVYICICVAKGVLAMCVFSYFQNFSARLCARVHGIYNNITAATASRQ